MRFLKITAISIVILFVAAITILSNSDLLSTNAVNRPNLDKLKSSNPRAYLDALRNIDPARWESEFSAMDKEGYEKYVFYRQPRSTIEKKIRIELLEKKLKTVASTDLHTQEDIYGELIILDDQNKTYEKKFQATHGQLRRKAEQIESQLNKYRDEEFAAFANAVVQSGYSCTSVTMVEPYNTQTELGKRFLVGCAGQQKNFYYQVTIQQRGTVLVEPWHLR